MATELFDKDGEPVEAYTKEEYESALSASKELEDYKKKVDDLTKELESKSTDKDLNFKELREKKEKAEKELVDYRDTISLRQNEIMAEIQTIKFDKQIREIVGDNQDLVDKIKFNFARITPPKEGEKDTRLDDAIILATGGKSNFSGFSSGDGTPPSTIKKSGLTEGQIDLGRKLGLTDEELKK